MRERISLQDFSYSCLLTNRLVNSVEPDQPSSQKLADLDLLCFQNWIYQDLYG